MVSAELLNTLQGLSRAEKLYVVQVLISGLAQQEADLIKSEQSYPVWSPYNAFEAANTMLEVLQATQNQNNAEC
ncbi:hypothetical protein LC605_23960 [Nostoc sp. CHAB 5836]|uniref:hypothetical protein n=1 Tax=Nostoc sp. CHAB 5836 TaxID=2780404 RepID=UPI001E3D2774|nr:hypothetical protein [Nostoc sp. CHAB 5836]MCC5618083.1 hypothetical protein [Nostoc sp. CHAB 5836]